jgi:putative restriction endonuclease
VTASLTLATISRLEKVAHDTGFDQTLPRDGNWLSFASTQAPLRLWLTTFGESLFIAAFSQLHVARSLDQYGTPLVSPLPAEAVAGRSVVDIASLYRLARRALQLSKTLPNELLHVFQAQTVALPISTEVERLVVQRVGQTIFRNGLVEYWEGRCAITGLTVTELLRASHIKPWADCQTDAERLDVFNGLLLAPHMDALFDKGFITVSEDGTVVVSGEIEERQRRLLGLDCSLRVRVLHEGHCAYLSWHREHIYRRGEVG